MFNFEQVKILLQTAGITLLTVKFDEPNQLVNVSYVVKGKPGKKVITFRELENILSIGEQSPSMSVAQRAGCVLDVKQELK